MLLRSEASRLKLCYCAKLLRYAGPRTTKHQARKLQHNRIFSHMVAKSIGQTGLAVGCQSWGVRMVRRAYEKEDQGVAMQPCPPFTRGS